MRLPGGSWFQVFVGPPARGGHLDLGLAGPCGPGVFFSSGTVLVLRTASFLCFSLGESLACGRLLLGFSSSLCAGIGSFPLPVGGVSSELVLDSVSGAC